MTLNATYICGLCNQPVDVEKAVVLGDVPFHEPCAYKYLDEVSESIAPTRDIMWLYIAVGVAFIIAVAAALGIGKLWW